MAYLRTVRLRGFKTFARPTELLFEPGISVVIGPNGSGKSNIADAVLWALGEQSASALRGRSMQDVIFSGSDDHRPSAFAEVSLVFENNGGYLPLDFAEVELTRRLLRDGSSEYRINGCVSRLLDIHELISGLGLGREMHTVISQGKVEELLNSTPLSRKALVEEAAGLGRYKKRRQRAQAKLERVEANLARVADVEREVRNALRPLKQQMEAADRHADLMEQLALIRATLLLWELRALRQTTAEAEAELEAVERRKAAVELGLSKLRGERTFEEGRFAEALRRREEIAGLYHRSRAHLDGLKARGVALRPRLARLEAEATRAGRRRESASQELAAAQERLLSLETLSVPGTGRLAWVQSAADGLADRLAELAPALTGLEREEEECKDRVFELEASRSRATQEKGFLRKELEERGRQAGALTVGEKAIAERLRVLSQEEAEANRAAAEADAGRASLAGRVEALGIEAVTSGEEVEAAKRSARDIEESLASLVSRERVLKGIVARREGVPTAGRALLDRVPGAVLVAQALRVATGYERAVAAALGPLSQAVVVGGERDLSQLGDGEGPLEIIWVPSPGASPWGPPSAGSSHSLGDVGIDSGLRPLWEVAIGEPGLVAALAALVPPTWVADRGLPSLALPPGARVVDREGRLLTGDAHGACRGEPGAEALFVAVSELEGLEAARAELAARLTSAVGRVEEAERANARASRALAEAEEAHRQAELEVAALGDARRLLARRTDQANDELHAAAERREAGERTLAGLTADLGALERRLTEDEAALEASRTTLHELRDRAEGLRREVRRVEEKRSRAAVLAVRIRERHRAVEEERARAEEQRRRAQTAMRRTLLYEQRLASVLPRVAALDAVVAALVEAAEVVVGDLELQVGASRSTTEGFAEILKTLGQREAAFQQELVGSGEGLVEVQVRLAHLRDQSSSREHELAELCRRHRSPREVDEASLEEAEVEGLRASLERLERRRERLGPVNPLAEQEYRETAERADFLQEQRGDLESSMAELRKVVRELDAHIEASFSEVFDATRRHFEAMIEVLFPGGKGMLKLVDVELPEAGGAAARVDDGDDDALEQDDSAAGLDPERPGKKLQGVALEVKPPRKAPRSLTLLSGGEKALAAIAFLFALFLARPCPFYILDEVEAALDDVNIGRFLSLVSRYQRETQFIIITHQRRTMEVAESLYGVAMDPDGTSRVLSRRLSRPESGAAGS